MLKVFTMSSDCAHLKGRDFTALTDKIILSIETGQLSRVGQRRGTEVIERHSGTAHGVIAGFHAGRCHPPPCGREGYR